MQVYVVVSTDGDYIGYFYSEVLGVYKSYKDAEKRKNKGVSGGFGRGEITIHECKVK